MQPRKIIEQKKAKKSSKIKQNSSKFDIDKHFDMYLSFDQKGFDPNLKPSQQKFKQSIPIIKTMLVDLNSPLMDATFIEFDTHALIFTISKNMIYLYHLNKEYNLNYLGCEEILLANSKIAEELTICRIDSCYNKDNLQDFLVAGGKTGLIYVIRLDNFTQEKNFSHTRLEGHANSIMDLAFPPFVNSAMKYTLLSGSRDGAIILWNYVNGTQIALFKPARAPIDDILAISWNLDGTQFISSALDETIKLWTIDEKVLQKIKEASNYKGEPEDFQCLIKEDFELKVKHLHNFHADQILYMNDFVITKDLSDSIYVWTFNSQNDIIKLSEFKYTNKDKLTGIKFDYLPDMDLLTIAGDGGEIRVYQALGNSEEPLLTFQSRKCFIRKAIILKQMNCLLCINEDGEILVKEFEFQDVFENES